MFRSCLKIALPRVALRTTLARNFNCSSMLMEIHSGNVKWFDADKGFGFIQPASPTAQDVFVHHTGICTDGGFRALTEGETVEYEVEEQTDGRIKAFNVTGPNGAMIVPPPPRRRYEEETW